MPLTEITVHVRGDMVILDPSATILVSGDDDVLLGIVTEWVERRCKKYVLNLHRLRHIDSAGIGDVVRSHLMVIRGGGRLKVCNVVPRVQAAFDVAKLTPILDIFESEDSAVHSFGEGASTVA